MNKKQIVKVSGAIITSFINLHYLEEVKQLKVMKQSAKNNLNRTIKDLIHIENTYFNEVEKIDDKNMSDKLVSNNITFVNWLLNEFDFDDFTKFQEVAYSFKLDKYRICSISDKILKENGAK